MWGWPVRPYQGLKLFPQPWELDHVELFVLNRDHEWSIVTFSNGEEGGYGMVKAKF